MVLSPNTDYTLPSDWHSKTDLEKDRWYKQERVYRQAISQDTPWARRQRKIRERMKRRREASSDTLNLEDWR